ncbi:MAG: class I SAM-dependent methyltransferase [Gaiellaceae bacterium]
MRSSVGKALGAVRARARRAAFFAARMVRQDLVARNSYSPVPAVERGDDPWSRSASLVGVDVDLGAQLDFFDSALGPYLSEFAPPEEPTAEGEFYLWNEYYQAVDAHVLYAMIRHLKPGRVLELGSGFSTLVMAEGCARNASDGHACELISVDPKPRTPLRPGAHARIERRRAESLPLERYLELAPGDVLFVDTSHAVKLGSEVNMIILEVLPRLRPGVVVHFHDIFLPFEYPRAWFERGTYPSEQYLLHAFLIENRGYEILLAVHALCRDHPDRVAAAIPTLETDRENYPSAFWLVRLDGATAS